MKFKILDSDNLIQGISDSFLGPVINPKENKKESEKIIFSFLEKLGWPASNLNLVWAEQTFSSEVHICQKEDSGKVIKNVDALISNIPGQVLVIFSADCVPLLLFDSQNRVVAGIHGGRKCLTAGIIGRTIEKMASYFNSKPENIKVGIGPHIRVCHYWLKEKTFSTLKKTKFKKYFLKKEEKVFFDLTRLTFQELLKKGVEKENIEDCQICTYCHSENFYSARKQEEFPKIYSVKKPRFISLIGIN